MEKISNNLLSNLQQMYDYEHNTGRLLLKGTDIDKSYHNTRGYRRIYFNSKVYLVHRLVFYYHHGYFPKVVDHIDGNVLNNKIENLQGCTQVENIAKARKFKNNTSGFTGVCYNKAAKKYESYFWKNYKKVYCGLWATAEEAYKAREEKKYGKL